MSSFELPAQTMDEVATALEHDGVAPLYDGYAVVRVDSGNHSDVVDLARARVSPQFSQDVDVYAVVPEARLADGKELEFNEQSCLLALNASRGALVARGVFSDGAKHHEDEALALSHVAGTLSRRQGLAVSIAPICLKY